MKEIIFDQIGLLNTGLSGPEFCLGHLSKNKKEIKLQLQMLREVHGLIHFGNVTLLCNIFTIYWRIKSGGQTWGTTAGVQVHY